MKTFFSSITFVALTIIVTTGHSTAINMQAKDAVEIFLDPGIPKPQNHFLITLYSSRVISAHRLQVKSDYTSITADDSILINTDSIQSIFYDKPGNPAPATFAGILIGATAGIVVGTLVGAGIFASNENLVGNVGAAGVALLTLFGTGVTAGTLIGHHLGSDKMYSFERLSANKKRAVLKHVAKIKQR